MTDTLINGNRPSFVNVSITIGDEEQPRGVFQSINYALDQQPGVIYSNSTSEIVGSTPGNSNATGSFDMLLAEFNALAASLTNDGQTAITSAVFDLQVSYSVNDIDVQVDKLYKVRITNVSASNTGTSASSKSCSFIYSQLVVNGVVVGGDTSIAASAAQGRQPIATDFWWPCVYEDDNGDWFSPGFVGNTYSKHPWDAVFIPIPYSGSEQPYTPGICEVTAEKQRTVDKKKSKGTDGARITVHGIELSEGEIRITIWTPQQYRILAAMWPVIFPGPQKFTTTKTVTVAPNLSGQLEAVDASGNTQTFPVAKDGTYQFFGEADSSGVTSGQTIIIPQTPQTKRISTTQVNSVTRPFDVSHPKLSLLGIKSVVFVKGGGPDPGPTPLSRVFTIKWVEYNPPGTVNATTTPAAAKASTLEPAGYQTPGTNPANLGPRSS